MCELRLTGQRRNENTSMLLDDARTTLNALFQESKAMSDRRWMLEYLQDFLEPRVVAESCLCCEIAPMKQQGGFPLPPRPEGVHCNQANSKPACSF